VAAHDAVVDTRIKPNAYQQAEIENGKDHAQIASFGETPNQQARICRPKVCDCIEAAFVVAISITKSVQRYAVETECRA
jgi:hypothetical protein